MDLAKRDEFWVDLRQGPLNKIVEEIGERLPWQGLCCDLSMVEFWVEPERVMRRIVDAANIAGFDVSIDPSRNNAMHFIRSRPDPREE
ncbi:MAG: hypothetical protein KDA64_03915 [Rhodospirillaceae bacterium]|nr:hypothetical protein [Rhodospirillaceae bacterium]